MDTVVDLAAGRAPDPGVRLRRLVVDAYAGRNWGWACSTAKQMAISPTMHWQKAPFVVQDRGGPEELAVSGGAVAVEAESSGGRTVFRVRLPLIEQLAEKA